jgi:hypothetical protein
MSGSFCSGVALRPKRGRGSPRLNADRKMRQERLNVDSPNEDRNVIWITFDYRLLDFTMTPVASSPAKETDVAGGAASNDAGGGNTAIKCLVAPPWVTQDGGTPDESPQTS